MGRTIVWLLSMYFPKRLHHLRKERDFTQQGLADAVGLHVNQIKRYEAGTAQPTLEVLVKLAKTFHVSLDSLVFGKEERGPDNDLRLQFEAICQFTPEEKKITKALLESLILKHDARRFERSA